MSGPGGPREEPDVPVDMTSPGLSLPPSFSGSRDPQASPRHPSRPLPLTGLNPWWATAPTTRVQQCPGHSQGRQSSQASATPCTRGPQASVWETPQRGLGQRPPSTSRWNRLRQPGNPTSMGSPGPTGLQDQVTALGQAMGQVAKFPCLQVSSEAGLTVGRGPWARTGTVIFWHWAGLQSREAGQVHHGGFWAP